MLGGAVAREGAPSICRLTYPYEDVVERAGLGSRAVLARVVESFGRAAPVVNLERGGRARSGDLGRSARRLAIPSLPLYKPALAAGRADDDGPAASDCGLVGRAGARARVIGAADAGAALLEVPAPIVRADGPLCLGAAVGKRRYRARRKVQAVSQR